MYLGFIEDLAFRHGKMAFVAGPRQVGKTTLSKQLLLSNERGQYHSCDDPGFRRQWVRDPMALVPQEVGEPRVIVFDELHKAPRWKTNLKGLFDTRAENARILVTGSARLDLFRRGGDSLVGRYFLFRMHPLTLGELTMGPDRPPSPADLATALTIKLDGHPDLLADLLAHGGFPEPYLRRDATFTTLWRRTRTERLVREDLRDMNRVHDVALIETAATLLPERVGSPFSYRSLAEDLEVSQPTAKRWVEWLEQIHLAFRIQPHHRSLPRALKKQPKLYLWDWSEVPDEGARFENIVAGHLLKAVQAWTDGGLGTFELRYLRDKEQREVDFLILRDRRPWMLVEAKLKDQRPSSHLRYFAGALRPAIVVQLVSEGGVQEWFDVPGKTRGQLVSADAFLRLLP
ncbi:MAG: ATP-binding protein [Polyangia bacterium]|jgi:predicted AAA+ superfamily ATPase|nr:ATP-binding protein [Polyangia bacterium]